MGHNEHGIDWSRFATNQAVQLQTGRETAPHFVRKAARLLPKGVQDEIMRRWYWSSLPTETWPTHAAESRGALTTSPDGLLYGFYPSSQTEEMCGVGIVLGDEKGTELTRAPIVPIEASSSQAHVQEGRYQIQIISPAPVYDPEQKYILYWSARVILMGESDEAGEAVVGIMSAMDRDRKPVGWLSLNECREPGKLRYAHRIIPGIVLPADPDQKEATVLKLHSIAQEREEAIPDDILVGSGLVAIQFTLNAADIDLDRRRRRNREREEAERRWQEMVRPQPQAYTMGPMRGITGLEIGKTQRFNTNTADHAVLFRPVVMVDVASSLAQASQPVVSEASFINHRQPGHHLADTLQSWGVPYADALKNG